MPTPTYYNLPQEKQDRIMAAAVDEFAQHRFSQASINRIVKAAGIPRGSFYQYFQDKEDLYLLVVQKIGREKIGILAAHPVPSQDATFFEAAVDSIPAILEWVERCPQYNRIGMLMAQDDSEFVRRIMGKMTASQQSVVDYLRRDQERGLLRADVDPQLVVEIILPVAGTLLREYYEQDGARQTLEKMKKFFEIIDRGISAKGE